MTNCEQCYCCLYHEGFTYYCKQSEKYYCTRECAYEDLGVKEVTRASADTCTVCGEELEPGTYETYEADGEFFCCTECVDDYFGIKFKVIESE